MTGKLNFLSNTINGSLLFGYPQYLVKEQLLNVHTWCLANILRCTSAKILALINFIRQGDIIPSGWVNSHSLPVLTDTAISFANLTVSHFQFSSKLANSHNKFLSRYFHCCGLVSSTFTQPILKWTSLWQQPGRHGRQETCNSAK